MNATRRLAVLAGAMLFSASSLFAYTANVWKADSSGNWDGRYSDVDHWSLGHLPKAGEDAVFENTSGSEFTVEIDCDVGINDGTGPEFFKIGNGSPTLTSMAAPVRFIGSGTVTSADRQLYVFGYRSAIFDGDVSFRYGARFVNYGNRKIEIRGNASLDFAVSDGFVCGATNEIVVAGGELKTTGSVVLGDGTRLSVSGGKVSAQTFSYGNDAEFSMTGGEATGQLAFNGKTTGAFRLLGGTFVNALAEDMGVLPATFTYEINGGRMVETSSKSILEPRIMPRNGGILDYRGQAVGALKYASSLTNELSGSIFETNMTAEAWIRLEGAQNLLYGGGRLSTDTIYLPVGSGRTVLDLSRLDLKKRIYAGGGHALVFPRDITIGAFGDWIFNSAMELPFTFENAATFDTRNIVTGAAQTFAIKRVVPVFGNAFRATGGGQVTLFANTQSSATSDQPSGRALSVDADTHLTLDAEMAGSGRYGRDAVIRFGDGYLGAGATLDTSKMKTVSPEFAGRLDVGEDAKVVTSAKDIAFSDASNAMDGGGLCWAVVSASGGEGIPLENVTVTDVPDGAKLKKVGPVIYLMDASKQTVTNQAPTTWTGKVNGNWDEPGNWLGEEVPTSTQPVYFTICDATNVVTVPAGGVTVANLWGGGQDATSSTWIRNSEPYVFAGGTIRITSTKTQNFNASIADCGKMPKIFECPVEGPNGNFGINVHNFMAFNGGLSAKSLCGSGDIRIGGAATCENWDPQAKFTRARATSLTVFGGGCATFTAQTTAIAQLSAFHVLGGSTLAFQGATGLRYVNSPENRNIIDGTLEASVFSADTDQTFVGTGRVDIASVVAGNAAGCLNLKGGIRFDFGSVAADAISLSLADYQFATLGATGDWTLPATRLGYRANLTLDTGDAHTITVGDRDLSDGYVTVAGTGTAKLASPLRVRRFTLADNAHLAIDRALPGKDWGDVLTATEVLSLDPEAISTDSCKVRVVQNSDGSMSVQTKAKSGLVLMVW